MRNENRPGFETLLIGPTDKAPFPSDFCRNCGNPIERARLELSYIRPVMNTEKDPEATDFFKVGTRVSFPVLCEVCAVAELPTIERGEMLPAFSEEDFAKVQAEKATRKAALQDLAAAFGTEYREPEVLTGEPVKRDIPPGQYLPRGSRALWADIPETAPTAWNEDAKIAGTGEHRHPGIFDPPPFSRPPRDAVPRYLNTHRPTATDQIARAKHEPFVLPNILKRDEGNRHAGGSI